MGYTHYYYRKRKNHDQKTWDKFVADCKQLAKNLDKAGTAKHFTQDYKEVEIPVMLNGCYMYRDPKFDKDKVYFNGASVPSKEREKTKDDMNGEYWEPDPIDAGHETLAIRRKYQNPQHAHHDEDTQFTFCKTARKPYDIMVTACLILYKYHFRKNVEISSDGDITDWQRGFAFIATVLPHGKQISTELLVDDGRELFENCLSK